MITKYLKYDLIDIGANVTKAVEIKATKNQSAFRLISYRKM